MTQTQTIEQLWRSLKGAGPSVVHRRVDEKHPLELYAEFEQPDRPGLVLFCGAKPPEARPLRALCIDRGRRPDGRWWLRLSLSSPDLEPVFSALCRDIVTFTRSGIKDTAAAAAILTRVERWRALLESDRKGLTDSALRGLIGELLILEADLLPHLPVLDAVGSWTGPLGTPQDFLLPSGQRIEVKAVPFAATRVRINGLEQLDLPSDPLTLAIVRLGDAGSEAEGAVTAPRIIKRLRERLVKDPAALNEFDSRLAAVGWQQHPDHDSLAFRVVAIERHPVGPGFPRLTRRTVLPLRPFGRSAALRLAPPHDRGGVPDRPSGSLSFTGRRAGMQHARSVYD